MPSPFPGMDPFIEGDEWEDFHINMITVMQSALISMLKPDYSVRVERVIERYLVIRKLRSAEVVTVIELLSPSNKRGGSSGRDEYLSKRDEILQSRTNLVEIDLLRGGLRLPTIETLPLGDYYVFVCRAKRRLKADVFAWPLAHRLPRIPIPLAADDREVELDLQVLFSDVFDRVGYDYSLDHDQPVVPPLSRSESKWVREVLKSSRETE